MTLRRNTVLEHIGHGPLVQHQHEPAQKKDRRLSGICSRHKLQLVRGLGFRGLEFEKRANSSVNSLNQSINQSVTQPLKRTKTVSQTHSFTHSLVFT